jgi:Icc-related predicted phosphoesterase
MILDTTRRGKHAGCQVLAARLKQLDACRLHVFGHIHEAHGACIVKDTDDDDGRVAVNAALICGKPAIIVDLAN